MSILQNVLAALTTMSSAQLRDEWQRVHRAPAPPLTADLLRRGIAWRLQERVHGGLPSPVARELQRLKRQFEASGKVSVNVHEGRIKPGTRLVRDWGGTSHHVLVLESGYHYRDRRYSSLSQIARDITGTHWSGPRFFGLRRGASSDA
ncbi:MAG: DUF2924 domain-containing protein [Pseudomonadota bacterium]